MLLRGRKNCPVDITDEPVLSDWAGAEAGGAGAAQRDFRVGPGLEEAGLEVLAIRHGPRGMSWIISRTTPGGSKKR